MENPLLGSQGQICVCPGGSRFACSPPVHLFFSFGPWSLPQMFPSFPGGPSYPVTHLGCQGCQPLGRCPSPAPVKSLASVITVSLGMMIVMMDKKMKKALKKIHKQYKHRRQGQDPSLPKSPQFCSFIKLQQLCCTRGN
uniref:Uncharacterized protein n=1 Tax=Peromyscus maniculatus bairdii TaxID=230844 RepID=A0A8C8W862_PERMB